jgi:Ubiquitin family
MRVTVVLDGALARPFDTGVAEGHDKVSALQAAIKELVKSKELMECNVADIKVYPLGITKRDYQDCSPLKPDDDLPKTAKLTPIFVHVPHETQHLVGSQRKMVRASYESGQHLTNDQKINIPKKKYYYKLGDTIPYYIEVQGWETTVGRLKERILETRGERGTAPDLFGVKNITQFQLFPPGRDEKTGKPLYPEMDDYDAQIPSHSTMKNPFIVPSVRNTEENDAAMDIIRKAREAKKKGKKGLRRADSNVSTSSAKSAASAKSTASSKKKTGITVQVKTPDGTMIPVKITKPSDTVQLIKETIAPEAGVEVDKQVLHFGGKEITNEQTAKDLGFKSGSVINLMPNGMIVKVRTPDGNTIPVAIDPSDTVESIKEKVAAESGIDVPEQIMMFNDGELPNDKTADEVGLQDGSVIDLEQKPITVQVRTPDGTMIPVKILPTDTIKFIKEQVQPETGMEVPDQVMKFENNLLPNNETAKAMGLVDGSIIDLEAAQPKPITVQVRTPDGVLIPVEMLPSDTIQFIKEAVGPEAGIEPPEQVLKYNGRELPSGETADDMGLQDGSIIDLEPQLITVQIKTPEGQIDPSYN